MKTSDRGSYRTLFSLSERPQYFRVVWNTLKSFWGIVGGLLSLAVSYGINDLLLWRFSPSSIKVPPILLHLRVGLGLFPVFILVVSFIVYQIKLLEHVARLERRSPSLRRRILRTAGIDDLGPNTDCAYKIMGITDYRGGVSLIVELEENSGLRRGSRLDVRTIAGGELWGVVGVDVVSNDRAWARPTNRIQKEFWERLEDVMKYDPTPPEGIHLEPAIPQGVRDFLLSSPAERK